MSDSNGVNPVKQRKKPKPLTAAEARRLIDRRSFRLIMDNTIPADEIRTLVRDEVARQLERYLNAFERYRNEAVTNFRRYENLKRLLVYVRDLGEGLDDDPKVLRRVLNEIRLLAAKGLVGEAQDVLDEISVEQVELSRDGKAVPGKHARLKGKQ